MENEAEYIGRLVVKIIKQLTKFMHCQHFRMWPDAISVMFSLINNNAYYQGVSCCTELQNWKIDT